MKKCKNFQIMNESGCVINNLKSPIPRPSVIIAGPILASPSKHGSLSTQDENITCTIDIKSMYLNQARTSQGTEDLLYHPYTIEYFIIKYFTGYKVFQYKAFHGSGRIHYHCALLILMIAVFMKRSHILHGMFPLTVNTTGILSFED